MADLLDEPREAGAQEQAAALTDRLPGAGLFELFRKQEGCGQGKPDNTY